MAASELPPLRTGHLFAGIGGFALAAKWIGWQPQWVAEIEKYPIAVLDKNFPGVPNLGDVTQLHQPEGSCDLITGGFPCQDISLAGKGAGIEGARSGLWKEYARIIDEVRPSYVLAENVSALRGRGLDVVLSDLDALGYDAEWHCIPAARIGAPHRRDRIYIVAWRPDANDPRSQGWVGEGLRERARERAAGALGAPESRPNPGAGRWDVEPRVGRVATGVRNRVDRIKALGNTVVPATIYEIYAVIEANRKQ